MTGRTSSTGRSGTQGLSSTLKSGTKTTANTMTGSGNSVKPVVSRRAENKSKLDSLEWNEDTIAQVSAERQELLAKIRQDEATGMGGSVNLLQLSNTLPSSLPSVSSSSQGAKKSGTQKSRMEKSDVSARNISLLINDDVKSMESKIARVQQRRQESSDRMVRQEKRRIAQKWHASQLESFQLTPMSERLTNQGVKVFQPRPVVPVRAISPKRALRLHEIAAKKAGISQVPIDLETAKQVAMTLNGYFDELSHSHPEWFGMMLDVFPLELFDSTVFNELLPLPSPPWRGACLLTTQEANSYGEEHAVFGIFTACEVLSVVLPTGEEFDTSMYPFAEAIEREWTYVRVELPGKLQSDSFLIPRGRMYLLSQNIDQFVTRVRDAYIRRFHAVSLKRLHIMVGNMPVDSRVTSTLSGEQLDRIFRLAASSSRLTRLETYVATDELNEARSDYEFVMNRLLFETHLLASKNSQFASTLGFPYSIFDYTPPAPQLGLIEVPSYPLRTRKNFHAHRSYLSSVAAIRAIHEVMNFNVEMELTNIVEIVYDRPFTLEKFERNVSEQFVTSSRAVKQDWMMRTGQAVRSAILNAQEALGLVPVALAAQNRTFGASLDPASAALLAMTLGAGNATDDSNAQNSPNVPENVIYDVNLRNVFEFERPESLIRPLLERLNFMMSDVLKDIVSRSLMSFTRLVEDLCCCEVHVQDIKNIVVNVPEKSIYRRLALPPLFMVAFRLGAEDKLLNQEEIDANQKEIAEWRLSKDAEAGGKCPINTIPEVIGKQFEYSQQMSEFVDVMIKVFRSIVEEFVDVPHLQKYVMERIYFPHPRFTESVPPDAEWVLQCRERVDAAMEKATAPLLRYLQFFKKYEAFVNTDIATYVDKSIRVTYRDPDSKEIELPLSVNLNKVEELLKTHLDEIREIEESLPVNPIECGLFLVDVVSVRHLLLDKHRAIIKFILSAHADRCQTISSYVCGEFERIQAMLDRKPESIEALVELEEYITALPTSISSLQGCITEMTRQYDLLDKYRHRTDSESAGQKWSAFHGPAKVAEKTHKVQEHNVHLRAIFQDTMLKEQASFAKTLHDLESQVSALENLIDLSDVTAIANRVRDVEIRLNASQARVKLFNSRETLFEQDITDYEDVNKIQRAFEPYANLWLTARDWGEMSQKWYRSRFVDLDAEEVERLSEKYNSAINKAYKYFTRVDLTHQADIASKIKSQVGEFMPQVPLIVTLRNPGMRERHWEALSEALSVELMPIDNMSTEQLIGLNLKDSLEMIQRVGESAAKEYQIEASLDKMEREWDDIHLKISTYRETGTGILTGIDEINAVLDEHITMAQTIMFSAFKGPFEERIDEWNRKLCCISDVLEVWITVQRNWLYLQPIFESPDINRQLPTEGKKFSTVDKSWRQTIAAAKQKSKVLEFCDSAKLLERFQDSEILLDQVQKGLSDYLETKRSVFARFYFLSNDELLSILSESKDVKRVQPHLKKCFEGIDRVKFLDDLKIDRMISPEGEELIFPTVIDPVEKNVEHWMLELEAMMRLTVRSVMAEAIADYTVTPRPQWMQKWAGMCVLNGSQMHWTREMEELFLTEGSRGPSTMFARQVSQLADMTKLVRGKLSGAARITIGALTVIDVHARDVIKKLVDESVETKDNFSWTSQLRYYWQDGDLTAQMVAATRPYGYEYLGNSFRLVITPLTDKCYLTLLGALQMIFGGAPAGPAGTGKTETTKDLAKALAMQCVVFNCSDGLDYIAMGKFFKGLAACGAWACFDEFNRINIEVLSVIGQQIMSIQMAIRARQERMIFEGSDIVVSERFAVFITMNPGYAGRSALPDSLQALFRPVAMMVPDYALIGEIMFFAYGFEYAKECGAKMVTTFKLCSEQLSSQPHYDYGMRAVKTVITAAGNLKRQEPDADEMVLLLRALRDVNVPKFLEMDLPLFEGIISDLFPGKCVPDPDYGALMATMKEEIARAGLQPVKFFIQKVIQLYEMIVVRHGLMLVGPTGGGKSSNLHILEHTLSSLKDKGIKGFAYEHVRIYQLNPKSITMGQMYGEFDPNTLEWRDGIMSTMYRVATTDETPDRKWIMFDGPVDAIWIENMNTVLDDNKKLCLNSGEIIKMSDQMTMMFEVEDLAVASPATVSRVGIIYMEPKGLGLDVLLQSWLDRMPPCTPNVVKSKITYYFDQYAIPAIAFLRSNLKELSPTVDNNLASSLLRILDCYLQPYYLQENRPPPTDLMISDLVTCIDAYFMFALIWSIGVTVNDEGRYMFDSYIRHEMSANKFPWSLPRSGMVYDYMFVGETKKWTKWMEMVDKFEVDSKLSFAEIVVPTMDSVRNTYLLHILLEANKHVLMVGGTGTGKTVNISQYLSGAIGVGKQAIAPSMIPLTMTFSANTSANLTQDQLDAKMDKRRKGVYGPAAGKRFYIYVDDLNMPTREEYGAQPPIELLRQWFDQGGWYDRKDLSFRRLIDLTFVASMGPPGGGRQAITARFLRHFNTIGYVELSNESKTLIFGTILRQFLLGCESASLGMLTDTIVSASIEVFNTICRDLLPTPSKSHYTFNLRDLAKVFQGMLMVDQKRLSSPVQLARLWAHETQRVFGDRLTCTEDHHWLDKLIEKQITDQFSMSYDDVVPAGRRLLYGDFLEHTEVRLYGEMPSMDDVKKVVEDYLVSHNSESKQPMPLVMFSDALEHVARIARVLRQPQGNALLLGVGGSGRQSMTKLATYIMGYALEGVEIVKGYSLTDWREDLKRILMRAGVKDQQTTFLFSDVQIISERMVEDINNVLNSGDVPNLYAPEDLETIASVCRVECQRKKLPPTKLNIFNQYLVRVRRNIHLCIAMSPLGEAFRNRLRNFPSLVNCCTIDWFTSWPADALQSVGISVLTGEDAMDLGSHAESAVAMFKHIHQSVELMSVEFYDVLRRHNYVTPTSYLELLRSFQKLMVVKRSEIALKRDRLQIGLDKLTDTKSMVSVMQEELVLLQPQLLKTQDEVSKMMIQITKDKASAAETKLDVEREETNANASAAEANAIAASAQQELDEAIPALNAALRSLNDLKKADIDEVRSLKTPPAGVVLTAKVCCFMFDVKPIKKNDPNNPGKKIDDYWEASTKSLFGTNFIQRLFDFDKDNIPQKTIKAIAPYIEDPKFTVAEIERSSKACTAICAWAHAMYKYHFVNLSVAPKRERLAEAEQKLAVANGHLQVAQSKLKEVNDRLAELESAFNEAVEKKDGLEKKEQSCKIQLSNADKLIGGLGGEEKRWGETVAELRRLYDNVLGDVIVSAATISYLGPFTADFRNRLVTDWQVALAKFNIPHSLGCTLDNTMLNPVELRQWQLCSLPSDSLSTQNALIMANGRRWPLLIDPQGQANRYIRAMAKDPTMAPNGMDVVKLSDKNFLRTLENGVQFGRWVMLENIGETLDAALEPILLQQKFRQGGQEMIKLGDNTVPYNDTFRFFMTTKLANPHYSPEIQVKVSLLNFTITLVGLEEQLLSVVVAEELPELSSQKANLVVQNASMNKALYDLESDILRLLSNSTGNILDDTVLIDTLAQSKVTSEDIKTKMRESETIEQEILTQSELYRPVAKRASLLYFVIADLGEVDLMYQYSLQWFIALFVRGISAATPAAVIDQRIINLNNFFTLSVYHNVCRSLFERHKLLFSFILTVKILQGDERVDYAQYRFLLSGISPEIVPAPRPETDWLEQNVWLELCTLAGLPAFRDLPQSFEKYIDEWQSVFDSVEPHRVELPPPFHHVTPLERLCLLRCLRRDRIELSMQDFIINELGEDFIQPPPFDLRACYNDSTPLSPLIFILSSGSDPNKELDILASEMAMSDRLKRIALGQGQGKKAAAMIEESIQSGDWVMLQNCHLSSSWMPTLEQICESFEPDRVNSEFRLWLTSMPSESFPTAILQNGVKITKEPPKGLRANLRATYLKLDNDSLQRTDKPAAFQRLLFGLSFYHALVIERKRFGPLGWNIPYEFNDTDMDITAAQLELYVSSYADIPYKVMQQLTSVVNYGGRITDDKDMRTSDILIADFFTPKILEEGYKFSSSGNYYSISPDRDAPHSSYITYIDSLPLNAEPEVFGMHDNANITCAITEADVAFGIILSLQPRVAGGGGLSREDQTAEMARLMAVQLSPLFDVDAISLTYPTDYHESMNTVLVQEVQRYNRLLSTMHVSLRELQRALKGFVVLSAELEAMGNAIFDQRVPTLWSAVAYPSLKPLNPWFGDFLRRIEFITRWVDHSIPSVFWISGFFFPQGFLTAILQNYARKYHYPIDTVSFSFVMRPEAAENLSRPSDGYYINGLFLEGARWDKDDNSLIDPKPKELFSPMPVIHMLPERNRVAPTSGIYRCPIYKILTRTGTLSTTGHSTNFVTWIEIPSSKETIFRSSLVSETNAQVKFADQDYWIKAGVAAFCALKY